MWPLRERQHRLLDGDGEDVSLSALHHKRTTLVTNRKKVNVPRRNENAHANCKNKPCAYCAALAKADREFVDAPDSAEERWRDGRQGTYQG